MWAPERGREWERERQSWIPHQLHGLSVPASGRVWLAYSLRQVCKAVNIKEVFSKIKPNKKKTSESQARPEEEEQGLSPGVDHITKSNMKGSEMMRTISTRYSQFKSLDASPESRQHSFKGCGKRFTGQRLPTCQLWCWLVLFSRHSLWVTQDSVHVPCQWDLCVPESLFYADDVFMYTSCLV